jgi:glycosyltransferase involved in cell wall biosynthesis
VTLVGSADQAEVKRSPAPWSTGDRWLVIAATGTSAAESFARAQGISPVSILTKDDIFVMPHELRRRISAARIDGAVVHSADWRRQQNPQLYELALAAMPVRRRLIADEARAAIYGLSPARSAVRAARLPADLLRAGMQIGPEAVRMTRRHSTRSNGGAEGLERRTILVIWPGSGQNFGGSITHITGILNGFRNQGFQIGLLTSAPPPDAVLAVIDDLEVMHALPAAMRLTGDTSQIAANRPLTEAGMRLARRLAPSFIYQRHSAFNVAGADLSHRLGIPLVLEWNGSEVWVRDNWETSLPAERIFHPLLVAAERVVAADADVVAAVSEEAANMALRAGASPARMLVLPNAVDIEYVDASLRAEPHTNGHVGPLLGWAGSFGPWHGAEMAVRALALLPTATRLVMVGEGDERGACESLADSLGVAERIEWTGAITRPAALRRLAACDLLVSPHVPLPDQPFFGSPTKIFEYMALGRPIVASRLAQIGDVLEDGVTARLVTPGELDELSAAILEVLDSEDQGLALGRAARLEAESSHTWDDRARSVLERLERVSS